MSALCQLSYDSLIQIKHKFLVHSLQCLGRAASLQKEDNLLITTYHIFKNLWLVITLQTHKILNARFLCLNLSRCYPPFLCSSFQLLFANNLPGD